MLATLPDFAKARILVVGDVMLDRYWSGKANRISPEAPVPVVKINEMEDRVGGAANVALNIAKLGGQVTLIGVTGADYEADVAKNLLQQAGVQCDWIISPTSQTICKLRILAQHQQLVRVDFEHIPLQFYQADLAEKFANHLADHTVIVFSDYGKGTLSEVETLIQMAKQQGLTVLVDPKGADYHRYQEADILTPNLTEFQAVMGTHCDEADLLNKAQDLLIRYQVKNLLLTRGESGMTLVQPGHHVSLPAQAKEVYDVTGAGDTVIAVLALGMALHLPLTEAMSLANLAGGIVVGKVGTSTVSVIELSRALHGDRDSVYGVVSEAELAKLLTSAKARGEKIVMTNGCFDILHVGHITYLEQAKALGDRLVVAVNSDASVKKLKGDTRPINNLSARMAVLAALACVDWVVDFNEETPERLYCRLLPDILVKGGDYSPDQVAGADCVRQAGGTVQILDFVTGYSTTEVLERSRSNS